MPNYIYLPFAIPRSSLISSRYYIKGQHFVSYLHIIWQQNIYRPFSALTSTQYKHVYEYYFLPHSVSRLFPHWQHIQNCHIGVKTNAFHTPSHQTDIRQMVTAQQWKSLGRSWKIVVLANEIISQVSQSGTITAVHCLRRGRRSSVLGYIAGGKMLPDFPPDHNRKPTLWGEQMVRGKLRRLCW